jgi:HlyD family secretion protein
MQRKSVARLGIPAFVLAAAAVVVWKHPWSSGGGPDLKYDTVAVDKGSIAAKVTASGTLSPRKNVQVGAQVSGRIIELDADFNDHVKKDQVIARLDPQLIDAQIAQNKANLSSARASLTKAQVALADATRQRKRQESLRDQNLVSMQAAEEAQVTEDTAKAALIVAQAAIAQSQATLDQSNLNRQYTTIKSPVDGVVISRDVDVGQTVAASLSAPTLFTIAEDLSLMQIDTSGAEGDVGRLSDHMKANFTVDAFPGQTFTGEVRQIRNSATTVSGVVTYDAVIDVINRDVEHPLRPGMTANVSFVLEEVASTIRIPNAALRFKPTPAQAQAMFGGQGGGRRGQGGAGGFSGGSGGSGRRRGSGASGGSGGATASAGSAASPEGGGGTSGSSGGGGAGDAVKDPSRKTVWKLSGGQVRPVRIKIGLTDGSLTQLVEGDLQPGDQLVTAVTGAPTSAPITGGGPPIRL